MKEKLSVDIIVVNWNSGLLTLKAIEPYINYKSDFINCYLTIVDNASTDNSKSLFLSDSSLNVIYSEQNLGFGNACNLVLSKSKTDYILLLNPDTTSTLNTLETLVNFLEQNTSYAIAGPQQLTEDNTILRTCARFPDFFIECYEIFGLSKKFPKKFKPKIMVDWDHLESKDVDHVMGSYMLIRRSVLNETGYMDPDYFVYSEDLDLSKRIHNAGYKSYFLADVKIHHIGGKSGGSVKKYRLFYWISSKRIYWKKHFNKFSYYSLTFLSIFAEPFTRIVDSVIKNKSADIKEILGAYRLYIKTVLKSNSKKLTLK
jgi:GT2 family glycosyltransferase